MLQAEYFLWPPLSPVGNGVQVRRAAGVNPMVRPPRRTSALSYPGQFVIRYLVLYVGWAFDRFDIGNSQRGEETSTPFGPRRGVRAPTPVAAPSTVEVQQFVLELSESIERWRLREHLASPGAVRRECVLCSKKGGDGRPSDVRHPSNPWATPGKRPGGPAIARRKGDGRPSPWTLAATLKPGQMRESRRHEACMG